VSERRTVLLAAATTGTGLPADCSGLVWLKAYLKGTGTVSSGTIVLEEADYFGTVPNTPWAGTWSAIGSPIACTDAASGAQKTYVLAISAYSSIRARFTADVTGGGSVDLVLVGVGP
jgi:hypothetical protein